MSTAVMTNVEVKVGDIFVYSWGYEQTNINFYQVIRMTPKSVVVREIGKREVNFPGHKYSMSGHVTAVKDSFIGEPMTKRLKQSGETPYINLNSYGWCSLWDGRPAMYTSYY